MKKSVAAIFACFLFIVPILPAQHPSPDVDVWQKEYEPKVRRAIESRTEQKPNFVNDVKFSRPDYIVYIPEVESDKLADTYNDHFLVFDKPDGTLFALNTQATCEGALDQHLSFYRSRDKGKTWEKPRVLAGTKTIAEGIASGGAIASWAFPLLSRSGRIYVLYNQFVPGKVGTHRQCTGIMMGMFSDDDGDTWSKPEEIPIPRTINDSPDETIPPEWIVWQKPLRLGKNGTYLVGVSHYVTHSRHSLYKTVTEFIHFENVDANPPIKGLSVRWSSTGEEALHFDSRCEEPAIVKLPDGRLFVTMRTGSGFPVWSISADDGETWTPPKPLLLKDGGDPIPHPLSPCPLYDRNGNEAASGVYFFFAHNKLGEKGTKSWGRRGPLHLFAGRYQKDAEQPVWFDSPKVFIKRPANNSFYTSMTILDGKTVLWYPDQKFYLLGRVIDDKFFQETP